MQLSMIILDQQQSYTQLDSRKQLIAFWDRVITRHKGGSKPNEQNK